MGHSKVQHLINILTNGVGEKTKINLWRFRVNKMNSYQQITDQIISNLEKATSWSSMINSQLPINITGRPYSGINILLLYNSKYKSRIWGTFRQIIKHGGNIRKNEKSSIVAFWSQYKPKQIDMDKPSDIKEQWFLKVYRVFNTEQCDFIENNEYLESLEQKLNICPPLVSPDKVISDYLAREDIMYQTSEKPSIPYYSPTRDLVSISARKHYKNNDEFYLTLFHELTHSTGHPKRLNRFDLSANKFGQQQYSLEELVAELGANFLASETGLKHDQLNSAAYIKGWIPNLKEHPRWIVSAASKAERASKFILNREGIS